MRNRLILSVFMLCTACGGSGTDGAAAPPTTTTYRVSVYNRSGSNTGTSLESDITVLVRAPTGNPGPSVPGAVVRFRATGGTLSTTRETADSIGTAHVHWSVPFPFAAADSLFACSTLPEDAACAGTEIEHVTP